MLKFLKLLLVIFLFSFQVNANDLIKKNKTDLKRIENYLQNIKNLRANFIQTSPDGTYVLGKFYLKRPGKMRIEYVVPTPILITVNGGVLAYKDVELEEVSYLRTNSTPASFLTRKKIDFSAKDIQVTNFAKENNLMKVSLVKKNKKEAGEFTLIFENNPINFLRMEVKDDMDQVTKVTLEDHDFKGEIDSQLFYIKNPQLP